MLPTTTLLKLAACFATFGQAVLASPEEQFGNKHLVIRQDKATDAEATTEAPKETSKADKGSDKSVDESTTQEEDSSSGKGGRQTADLNTAKPSETGTDKSKDDKGSKTTGSSSPKKTKIPANAPAGGLDMVSPSAIAATTELYRISDTVTWSWNYTSVLAEPTAVDVLVSCSVAAATWTLTANMSFETSVEFEWDTKKQANDPQQPLLTELYTLIVKDSAAEISDTPEPGYLGASSNFVFGLYKSLDYVDLDKWECTGCDSAGVSGLNSQAATVAITMSLLTVLSFTWFVTGLALH